MPLSGSSFCRASVQDCRKDLDASSCDGIARTYRTRAAKCAASRRSQQTAPAVCGVLTLSLLGTWRQASDAAEEMLYLSDHLDEGVGGDRFRDVAVGVQSVAFQHVFLGA